MVKKLAPDQELEKFFTGHARVEYKKGETILHAGDFPQGVYFLKKGYVRLFSISEDGKELTLVIYKPGGLFPVVWAFFGRNPSIYHFETLGPAILYRAPRDEFVQFLAENPRALLEVTKGVIRRFSLSLRRMEYLTFGTVSARLASVLLIYAKELGVEKGKGQIEIQLPVTHEDLSNLVGVARETVSIELKKLERQRLIRRKNRLIIVKNKKGLEDIAILSAS